MRGAIERRGTRCIRRDGCEYNDDCGVLFEGRFSFEETNLQDTLILEGGRGRATAAARRGTPGDADGNGRGPRLWCAAERPARHIADAGCVRAPTGART